jgi:flagellar basal body-associated protein FliL
MAEDEEDAELSDDEKEELEGLLEGEDDEEAEGSKLQKILANKKVLIIVVVLLLLIIAGVAFFFLQNAKEAEVVPLENKVNEEVSKEEKEEEEEDEEVKIGKVNIYKLEPFFLPLLDDGKETGQFISVSANLLMSNSVLGREINKVLPLLRKNIYNILKRKQPLDFMLKRSRTEEIIKKEILTASNALLLSGSGTISDVFFSRFMIK